MIVVDLKMLLHLSRMARKEPTEVVADQCDPRPQLLLRFLCILGQCEIPSLSVDSIVHAVR